MKQLCWEKLRTQFEGGMSIHQSFAICSGWHILGTGGDVAYVLVSNLQTYRTSVRFETSDRCTWRRQHRTEWSRRDRDLALSSTSYIPYFDSLRCILIVAFSIPETTDFLTDSSGQVTMSKDNRNYGMLCPFDFRSTRNTWKNIKEINQWTIGHPETWKSINVWS